MLHTRISVLAVLLPLFACSGQNAGSLVPLTPSTGAMVGRSGLKPQNVMALPGNVMALPGNEQLVCARPTLRGQAQCPAILNLSYGHLAEAPALAAEIPGYHPADIQAAYALASATGGYGAVVAVVAKGDDPNAARDLAVYRRVFGLPPCTVENGCFRKVNEYGSNGDFPDGDYAWSTEIALDLDMASAACPNCHILLVEANTASIADLGTAVDTAARLGATAISNSYYTPEYDGEQVDARYYDHPGIAITVSAGDGGYGATFPASAASVTAVGGTTLARDAGTSRGWAETVWSFTASGCSAYISKPSWQSDTGCAMRTMVDLAVVGDPDTGVAAFNTYAPPGERGWAVYGGTSVGAPIVAAIYALARGEDASANGASRAYANPGAFNPVLSGSDGTCAVTYLCTAGSGYNGPAGLGTPKGTNGF